jgi:large subunit ribosomal protein L24
MKKEFSKTWKASKQPRKQRKFLANAPLHIKRKQLSTNLSKELRKKVGKRNVILKKEDKVKIMRGKFKGKTGKVLQVFTKLKKVIVEGIQVTKKDGSKANIKLENSNLQIIELSERKDKKVTKKEEIKNKEEQKNKIKEKKE